MGVTSPARFTLLIVTLTSSCSHRPLVSSGALLSLYLLLHLQVHAATARCSRQVLYFHFDLWVKPWALPDLGAPFNVTDETSGVVVCEVLFAIANHYCCCYLAVLALFVVNTMLWLWSSLCRACTIL